MKRLIKVVCENEIFLAFLMILKRLVKVVWEVIDRIWSLVEIVRFFL